MIVGKLRLNQLIEYLYRMGIDVKIELNEGHYLVKSKYLMKHKRNRIYKYSMLGGTNV